MLVKSLAAPLLGFQASVSIYSVELCVGAALSQIHGTEPFRRSGRRGAGAQPARPAPSQRGSQVLGVHPICCVLDPQLTDPLASFSLVTSSWHGSQVQSGDSSGTQLAFGLATFPQAPALPSLCRPPTAEWRLSARRGALQLSPGHGSAMGPVLPACGLSCAVFCEEKMFCVLHLL